MADNDNMLNLEDFICEALTQIHNGVARAQKNMEGRAEVGGLLSRLPEGANSQLATMSDGAVAHLVAFDVALTVNDATSSTAKIGILSGVFGAGASAGSVASGSEVSRVQFTVPIRFDQKKPVSVADMV